MVDFERVRREHVLRAVREYDGGRAVGDYLLYHDGRTYDAGAVVDLAGELASAYDPESELGARDSALLLRGLGFDVEGPDLPALRFVNATTVGRDHARDTWALAARERLEETARSYHATIGFKELAEFVQRRSLIRTNQQHMSWIGDVLNRVCADCATRREPLLNALCVDTKGRVGTSYVAAVEQHRGAVDGDPDEHAAHEHAALERLECYRHFGAELPPGGGEPAMPPKPTPKSRATERPVRARATKTAAAAHSKAVEEKPLVICPVHFTVLPASGVCDLCE
jgi:hypothetical protein